MAHKWFIHCDNKVSGPFTTEAVNNKVTCGELPETASIWWRGQPEWKPVSFWREHVQEILESVAMQTGKPIWYVELDHEQHGPFTRANLISYLASLKDLARVFVWSAEKRKRTSLFEMHDVMEQIGINRRDYERIPLLAEVAVSLSGKDTRVSLLQAASISKGGIGVRGDHELQRGDQVALMIMSQSLGGKIFVNAEVAYVTEARFAGLRFLNPTAETLSAIEDYVRSFEENTVVMDAA